MPDLVMPKFGLTMTEGLLSEWRVAPGEAFRAGQVLFTVETEKVATEVEAEADGRVSELLVAAGETVPVGAPIARVEGANGRAAATPLPAAPAARIVATPLARRLAREAGVDLAALRGSGPNGRIKAADIPRETPAPAPPETPAPGPVPPEPGRAATARLVTAAKRDVPHFYLTHEAEISALSDLRDALNAEAGRPRVTLTHMLVRALGLALAEAPRMNRVWTDAGIVALPSADVGVVVETPDGPRVPILRAADALPLDAVAERAGALAARARAGRLTGAETGDAAVSVSNVGMFGVTSLTPVLNPPNAMILGVGAARALFRPGPDGAPALRREMTLTLACDHRILDGAEAARFLAALVALLEAPLGLLRPPRAPR